MDGAGLFGPSNYGECILESMKGVSSDRAAAMVAIACRKEFPTKKKKSSGSSWGFWDSKPKKVLIDNKDYLGKIRKIEILSLNRYFERVTFMNRNDFKITQVHLGIVDKSHRSKNCPSTLEEYRQILNCYSFGEMGSQSSDEMQCDGITVALKGGSSYCIVGYDHAD